jgi:hypothetical protein
MRAVDVALTQVGVREQGGRNRGPEVDEYIRAVGLDPTKGSYPWCAAFVSWCVAQAANHNQIASGRAGPPALPIELSAGVFDMLRRNTRLKRERPQPGYAFVLDYGVRENPDGSKHRPGHIGFVIQAMPNGTLETVEGNTNAAGSREGDGVYVRTRKVKDIYCYLDVDKWEPAVT